MSASQRRSLLRWVGQFAAGRGRVLANTTALLQGRFRSAPTSQWYSGDGVQEWASQAAESSRSAQRAVASLTDSYLDRVLDLDGVSAPHADVDVDDLRGVDPVEVWSRPAEQYRFAASRDKDPLEAAFARIEALSDGDVRLAERMATKAKLAAVESVIGYRRILHPELSAGGSCGLCVAAADLLYKPADLLPIHPRCQCTVLPVIKGRPDPKSLNPATYKQVLEISDAHKTSAGAPPKTTRADLGRVRVRVVQHSELGAVLTYERGSLHIRRLVPATAATAA